MREGLSRKDDKLPKLMFQPLENGPAKGECFKDLERMLDEYYEAFGWEKINGTPSKATLKKLDMEDSAEALD